jgi:predicted DNA-binding transcriptional regulator AlpA
MVPTTVVTAPDDLMNVREIAALAKLRPRTIREWIKERKFLAPRMLNGEMRWLRSELLAYLRELPERKNGENK